ncbi:hypothetical protein FHS34_006614 [Streptomyces echinatus]|uniref:Uncharacterized protein n=1 Tax=Streptomyces echinatus TaxID=67293 RepID=A0A7W9Q1F6_9ACTN|nr:hypothetical protein [Streptomyces echinatus]
MGHPAGSWGFPAGSPLRGAEVELLRLVESRPGIGIPDAARPWSTGSPGTATWSGRPTRRTAVPPACC